MKFLHLSTTDSGGAAGAAIRIHRALVAAGQSSRLLVAVKRNDAPDTEALDRLRDRAWKPVWQRLNAAALRLGSRTQRPLFSPALFTHGGMANHPAVAEADVVCLYWIAGMLSARAIAALPRPVVWRLSDEWAYTGGCHYAGDCPGFMHSCGTCPVLGSRARHDLSRLGLGRRVAALAGRPLTIVAPSRWIAARAAASRVFAQARIVHVATGVDLKVFAPTDRTAARAALDLPQAAKLIVFGAAGGEADPRKGFDLLRASLARLVAAGQGDGAMLAIFGSDEAPRLDLPVRTLGVIREPSRLALLLAAADAVGVPSRQDNLPQVAIEAAACGAPVVAFDVGGIGDAVRHRESGWLAAPESPEALAEGFAWAFAAGSAPRRAARRLAEAEFDLARQAQKFLAVAASAVAGSRP